MYAVKFLEKVCLEQKLCRTSNMLFEEVKDTPSEGIVHDFLKKYFVLIIEVNIDEYLEKTRNVIESLKLSYSRLLDIAHVLIAKDIGCNAIASFDRKMLRFAKRIGLKAYNPRYGWV